MNMKSGIREVAEMAGVSIATVSHVFNNTRFVSSETKAKVFQAMKQLDFRPNAVAQSLRSQKSNTIGLIVPILPSDTSNFFFMTVAQGIQHTLKQHGYHVLLSNNSTEELEAEKEQIRLFNSKLIDGLIIAPISNDVQYMQDILNPDFPVVFIDRKPNGFIADCVVSDDYGGSHEAVSLLLEKGHRKIGLITGSLGISTSLERFEGYKTALAERGVSFDSSLVKVSVSSYDGGYQSAKDMLAETDITGLFISNNVLTLGAIGYMQEKRVKIPSDIAVIGFDDYDWTRITNPPLTVISQPSFELGQKAAKVILQRIMKTGKLRKVQEHRLSTRLIIRGSC
jgi:LacI family transcriptional regulator